MNAREAAEKVYIETCRELSGSEGVNLCEHSEIIQDAIDAATAELQGRLKAAQELHVMATGKLSLLQAEVERLRVFEERWEWCEANCECRWDEECVGNEMSWVIRIPTDEGMSLTAAVDKARGKDA